jgi:sugar phosphate permease
MTDQLKMDSPQPYRWVVLALVTASFLFTFIARFTWPPLIPVVVPILGMKMSQAGAFMSAFYLGYVITQVPAGLLADRFGVRLLLAISLALEGLTTWAMGSIGSYEAGFALRLATGLGAGAVYSGCTRAIMDWFPPKERGTAFGLLLAAPSGGILLSSLIVPQLNAAFSWNFAFQAVGITTLIVGVLVYSMVRTSESTKSAESMFAGFKVVFTNKDLVFTALSGFCLLWVELGTATWTIAHIKKLGFSLASAGGVMTLYGVGGLLGPFVAGWISDRVGHRKYLLMVSLLLVIPVTLFFGRQTTIESLTVWALIFGFISYAANPHLTTMVSEFAGRQYAATANGISNFVFQFASILGPWVMGLSLDITGEFNTVWWIMAAGPALGILFLIPVNEKNVGD